MLKREVLGNQLDDFFRDGVIQQVDACHARLAREKIRKCLRIEVAQRDQVFNDLAAAPLLHPQRLRHLIAGDDAFLYQ